jgi:tripartite ATP-independent transporter DctM subunit
MPKMIKRVEDILVLLVFVLLSLIPAIEIISRFTGIKLVSASPVLVQHLTLWIGFLGAVIATRENRLLSLSSTPLFSDDAKFHLGRWISKMVSFLVVIVLLWGSIQLVWIEFQYPIEIAPGLPRWVAQLIMPFGFGLIAIQILIASGTSMKYRASIFLAAALWLIIQYSGNLNDSFWIVWISFGVIMISLFFGTPIFVGLGGVAALFFWHDFIPVSAISAETYRIVVSPSLPTIPLFTLTGYILAESGASKRMMKVFQSAFGWIPGGTPIIVVIISGFFTAMTGGSGVTILALGGLLYPMLRKEGYSELFSLGLITVAGSLGLLFPPSLPAIIYGVTAGVSVKDVFIAGIIPGILLLGLVSGWAIYQGKLQKIVRTSFSIKPFRDSIWEAKWELSIPVFILFGIFGGFTTLVETASIIVIYSVFIEIFVYKDLTIKDIPKIVFDCAALIGGVLIILGAAMGLTSLLVDAQIPILILAWVKSSITSKYLFLFMLNIFLLLVGTLMDIFSAIIVIVPLIIPLGAYFGVDPVHLAIIFIANLELGFLTPPVGMNLFLSAYRFNKTMPEVYKATLPFFIVRLLAVLAITYLPFISLWLVK